MTILKDESEITGGGEGQERGNSTPAAQRQTRRIYWGTQSSSVWLKFKKEYKPDKPVKGPASIQGERTLGGFEQVTQSHLLGSQSSV